MEAKEKIRVSNGGTHERIMELSGNLPRFGTVSAVIDTWKQNGGHDEYRYDDEAEATSMYFADMFIGLDQIANYEKPAVIHPKREHFSQTSDYFLASGLEWDEGVLAASIVHGWSYTRIVPAISIELFKDKEEEPGNEAFALMVPGFGMSYDSRREHLAESLLDDFSIPQESTLAHMDKVEVLKILRHIKTIYMDSFRLQ